MVPLSPRLWSAMAGHSTNQNGACRCALQMRSCRHYPGQPWDNHMPGTCHHPSPGPCPSSKSAILYPIRSTSTLSSRSLETWFPPISSLVQGWLAHDWWPSILQRLNVYSPTWTASHHTLYTWLPHHWTCQTLQNQSPVGVGFLVTWPLLICQCLCFQMCSLPTKQDQSSLYASPTHSHPIVLTPTFQTTLSWPGHRSTFLKWTWPLMVVVNHGLTKGVILISCSKTIDAAGVAKLFLHHVFKWFRLHDSLISNRGPQFASAFARELAQLLQYDVKLSTTYHPQIVLWVARLAFEGQGFTYSEGGTHKETLHPQRSLRVKNRRQEDWVTTRWVVDCKTNTVIA